ncbi:hypothetical protein LTR10_010909 [Elasticomyces elasticus]|nr:hypothetical protein LTR10_010909 [Elasticomyces elasticus]KAK4968514.1 hypothetical protein LTR42_009797 [Elasticomyces elasticus]
MAEAAAAAALPRSMFLTMLPAELRNEIYEMVFAGGACELDPSAHTSVDYTIYRSLILPVGDHDDRESEVDMYKANPPSLALLQTCHEICAEAKSLYQAKLREYFETTKFMIRHYSSPSTCRLPNTAMLAYTRDIKLYVPAAHLYDNASPPRFGLGSTTRVQVLLDLCQIETSDILTFLRDANGAWWCDQLSDALPSPIQPETDPILISVDCRTATVHCLRTARSTTAKREVTPLTTRELAILMGLDEPEPCVRRPRCNCTASGSA